MVFRVNRPVPPPSLIPLPPTPFPLRLVIAGWLGAFEVDNFVGELVEELAVVLVIFETLGRFEDPLTRKADAFFDLWIDGCGGR